MLDLIPEIMTGAESRGLTDCASQVPPQAAILSAGVVGSRSEAPFICFPLIHERKCALFAAAVLPTSLLLFSPEVVDQDNKRDVSFQQSFINNPDPAPL